MKPKTHYQQRLAKVINFIGQNLDKEISLESISEVFCVSKFHFHRLFTAFTGLSLQQYIRWLRLKRAAHQLKIDKDQSIINIAIRAGFESHEAFSRAFKKACGQNPSQYRNNSDNTYWEKSPYFLPREDKTNMNIEIKNINEIRLAMVEHQGDPNLVTDSVNQLIAWAKAQAISLKPKAGEAFGFGYNDPHTTPAAEFRLDLGIKIPKNLKLESNVIVEKFIPSGRYAVVMHKGSRNNLGETIYPIYRDWLPNSGEQLGDFPCIFCYYNFDHEVAETELLTECWFLLE